jgi:hypothetical protein
LLAEPIYIPAPQPIVIPAPNVITLREDSLESREELPEGNFNFPKKIFAAKTPVFLCL